MWLLFTVMSFSGWSRFLLTIFFFVDFSLVFLWLFHMLLSLLVKKLRVNFNFCCGIRYAFVCAVFFVILKRSTNTIWWGCILMECSETCDTRQNSKNNIFHATLNVNHFSFVPFLSLDTIFSIVFLAIFVFFILFAVTPYYMYILHPYRHSMQEKEVKKT